MGIKSQQIRAQNESLSVLSKLSLMTFFEMIFNDFVECDDDMMMHDML